MDLGTVCSVVQTLLAATQSPQLIAFCSKKSISVQLQQLEGTVRRIQGVLKDAESKQFLSNHEEVYIDELKDAVFEADDLFDEFVTLANLKKLNDGTMDRLLSVFTKFKTDYKISHKIDKIKQKLDDIAGRNQLICFDPQPIKMRSRETCSYVHVVDIIGRDDDLEKIVGILLQSDGRRAVSFLSIVGIGGLGKTALAQLVFNDPRVTSAFSLKMWTCVSDQVQHGFDVKEILGKILEAATEKKEHHDASKDRLQNQLRQKLDGKKYLLVLDDVWTENREQWCKLADFLMGGQRGSWILVTTRSKQTARIIGDGLMHELKGLSKDDSWRLFEKVAFEPELSSPPPQDLVSIGQKIVEKCANVPLAIRVAGSLLYGQDKRKWLSFQELPLTKFEDTNSGIMPILKISYHQLESPLKSCFGYCALFPKDYVMERKTLLRLWMAQGYIPSCDQRRMEDVAEEYFLVLLRRSFFQDVKENEYGEIYACKIHDLMHDVATEVVGKEMCMLDGDFDGVDKKVLHVSTPRQEIKSYTFHRSCIRSYLQVHTSHEKPREEPETGKLFVDALLSNWKHLRVLDLCNLNIKTLSSSIGELLHLRYLDLSFNCELDMLPLQITKLYNLETLILYGCVSLKELPKDMLKLVKLRVLDISSCDGLSFLPRGMGNLSRLEELSKFFLGELNSSLKKISSDSEDLNALTNLKGHIEINIRSWRKDGTEGGREEGCLSNKPHLSSITLNFRGEKCEGRMENDNAVIEELHPHSNPHSNLKMLQIISYQGLRMPKWAREDTLANLMYMRIENCFNLETLGCLETLKHLNLLRICKLWNLEWLFENKKNTREGISEMSPCSVEGGMSLIKAKKEFSFFPSLKSLYLGDLPKLKVWRRGVGMEIEDIHQVLYFPKLENLIMDVCPNLVATLACPRLKHLRLCCCNNNLGINSIERIEEQVKDEIHKLGEALPTSSFRKLRNIEIFVDKLGWLNCQNINMEEVEYLNIVSDKEVLSLEEGREVFCSCSSSLRYLAILNCSNLRSVSGGLEHLTALETLVISNCPKLRLSEGENGMPWKSLNHSLRTLYLLDLPQLINLPSWIQLLTALQTLKIDYCKNLNSLPSWMRNLSSLKELRAEGCSRQLKERCEKSSGEDWPHIQHIPSISITDKQW